MKKNIVVVLLNLGGPEDLSSVKNFLYNLFSDKFIIRMPKLIRLLLAKIISNIKTPTSKKMYQQLGNKSTLLEETLIQAKSLKDILINHPTYNFKIFISMRYWHPFSYEVISNIKKYDTDLIILLPLYPQFSTATTLSSVHDFKKKYKKF